jgi:hypothetical protein
MLLVSALGLKCSTKFTEKMFLTSPEDQPQWQKEKAANLPFYSVSNVFSYMNSSAAH